MGDEPTRRDDQICERAAEPRDAASSEAFELLSHDLRIAILDALLTNRQCDPEQPSMSYSALLAAVDAPDSGQFNYHLNKLRPQFVTKTENGYRLSVTGRRIMGAMLAGAYEDANVSQEEMLAQSCPTCDDPLRATFESGVFRVRCSSDHVDLTTGVPVGALDERSIQDLTAVVTMIVRHDMKKALEGVCPHCYGHMSCSVERSDGAYRLSARCDRCGMLFRTPVGFATVCHPLVVAFLYEHGYEFPTHPPWTFEFCTSNTAVQRINEDPLRLRVTLQEDGDRIAVDVDDSGTVVDVTRQFE